MAYLEKAEYFLKNFEHNGYCVIPNFLTNDEVNELRASIDQIAAKASALDSRTVFVTYDDGRQVSDRYFLESVDKINYFYEEGAFDKQGNLVMPHDKALNKVGHALHVLNPAFRKITFSQKVVELVKSLGLKDAVIPQSMCIFKQPGIGGVVIPHIDCTYLLCDPPTAVVGVWIPLEDATVENGCLWFVPGSHKTVNKVTRRFVRINNPTSETLCHYEGQMAPPADEEFVATPAKKGSCVLIHCLVWHKSEQNKSDKSRLAYTFHVFDQGRSKWDSRGWLQPTDCYKFPSLYREHEESNNGKADV